MPSRTQDGGGVEQPAADADNVISIDIEVAKADRFLKHLIGELAPEQR